MLFTVLGGHGFVGSHLLARLSDQGHRVHAPAREDQSWLDEDLGHVFYCVGLTNDFYDRPFDTVEAHSALLARVLRAGRFERLVYLSSTRLYDALPDDCVNESTVLQLDTANPRSLYDLSKSLGENLCLNHSGDRACVARLSCVYSDTLREGGFLAQVLPRALSGETFTLDSSAAYARDYVHIDDVTALLQDMLVGAGNGIYNVCAGGNTSNEQLMMELRRVTGARVTCSRTDTQHMPRVSNGKASQAFGFRPRQLLDHLPAMLERLKGSNHGA